MAEELLSLKWNNHQAHFVDILGFLREQEVFVDTTLACGGKLYPVHKFVLSTCSEYFKQMFTKNPAKHPIVFMKDVTSRDLEALLDFMYNGEVNVPQSSLGSLIKTAEGLQIKGLAVPDDPPTPKQKENINEPLREKRDSRHINTAYSPPPKRQRPKEIYSPPPSSNAPTIPQKSHSPSKVEELVVKVQPPDDEEDSRTSIHSGVSGQSENTNSVNTNVNNVSNQFNSDRTLQNDRLNSSNDNEPSPGPSGMQPKDDEMTIKQEDVVDLGEDEEDWGRGDSEGYDSMGIKPDHNASSVFPEMLLHQDGGLPPSSDAAMFMGGVGQVATQLLPLMMHSAEPAFSPLLSSRTFHRGPKSNRQESVKNKIQIAEGELLVINKSLATNNLSNEERSAFEEQYMIKSNEIALLKKELSRLISGQMRQRKFREKMKKMRLNYC